MACVGVQIFFHHFPSKELMSMKSPSLFFVKAFGWRFTNIVQQGSPTQPDIIRIRANIVYDSMIKLFLWV
jgi:hypothetical protein